MNGQRENRIYCIDVARGLGIIFVVIGHILYNEKIINWIVSFHMPLFLFLSGYLFRQKGIWEIIKIKEKKFLGSYCLFSIISIIYYWTVEYRFRRLTYSFTESIIGGVFCYIPFMNNAPLWYLPCAFIIIVLYDVLNKKFSSKVLLFIGIIFNSLYWLTPCHGLLYSFPYELPRVFDLFIYFCIGKKIGEYRNYINNILYKITSRKIELIGMAIVVYAVGFIFSQYQLYSFPVICIVLAILSICGTICVSIAINGGILMYIGRASLFILCTHALIYRPIIGIVSKVSGFSSNMIRSNGLFALLIVVLTILVCIGGNWVYRPIEKRIINRF